MPAISRFEDIEAWQTARELTNLVYELSNQADFSHDFGLRDQMRRAGVSVMSNIAEGFESQTQSLFITYLYRAKASAGEVRAQLYIALDQQYINQPQFEQAFNLVDKCSRHISNFIRYLKSKPSEKRMGEDAGGYG